MTRIENVQAHKAKYKAKFIELLNEAIRECPLQVMPATQELGLWNINDLVCDLFHGSLHNAKVLDNAEKGTKVTLTPEQIVILQNHQGAESKIDDLDMLTASQVLTLEGEEHLRVEPFDMPIKWDENNTINTRKMKDL